MSRKCPASLNYLYILAFMLPNTALAEQADVASLKWLVGCWVHQTPNKKVLERWLPLEGSVLLGVGYRIQDSVTTNHEFMEIIEHDGSLIYVATPSSQTRTTFTLKEQSENNIVFVNSEHDFPQYIAYQRQQKRLNVSLQGVINGASSEISYQLNLANCHK